MGDGWIELERPLQYDIRPAWQVWVYRFEMSLQHSGYEDFTVLFKHGEWGGGAGALRSCCCLWLLLPRPPAGAAL